MASSKYHELDTTELSQEAQDQLAAYRAAYKAMKSAREQFELAATKELPALPAGKAFSFGYNFGKVAVTIVDASERKAKAQPKGSLAEWMRDQVANGDRT